MPNAECRKKPGLGGPNPKPEGRSPNSERIREREKPEARNPKTWLRVDEGASGHCRRALPLLPKGGARPAGPDSESGFVHLRAGVKRPLVFELNSPHHSPLPAQAERGSRWRFQDAPSATPRSLSRSRLDFAWPRPHISWLAIPSSLYVSHRKIHLRCEAWPDEGFFVQARGGAGVQIRESGDAKVGAFVSQHGART